MRFMYLLYAIAFYALLFGLRYLLMFLHLKKAKFQYAEYTLKPSREVPDYIQRVFQSAIQELAPLGFKPCSYRQVRPISQIQPSTVWSLLFYHPTHKTYAEVDLRLLVEASNCFEITFITFFHDKSLLMTLNGRLHGVIGEIPNATLQDAYAPDVATQWQFHQTKLQQLAAVQSPVGLAPEVFTKLMQERVQQYIDRAVEQKLLLREPTPGLFRYRTWAALKRVHLLLKGNQKAAKLSQQRQQKAKLGGSPVLELPIELEVESFERMEYMQPAIPNSECNI